MAQSLEEIQDALLDRVHAGEDIDRAALLAAHPEHAVDLAAFLDLLDVVEGTSEAGGVPPSSLGEFRILREIGRGGMGVVYEAEQASLKRRVALKVLPPALRMDTRLVKRFRREAEAAGRLSHPGIVPVFGVGQAGDTPFFAMEFVPGSTLREILHARKKGEDAGLPTAPEAWRRWAVETCATVADALAYAHGEGILHRDVKPGNILINAEGKPRLTDFGLAQDLRSPGLSLTGEVLGSPQYMSPEQAIRRDTPVDEHTDIYSLAVTLYQLLTLELPYPAETHAELLTALAAGRVIPPRQVDPDISRSLEQVLLRALRRNPEERYAGAAAFGADLRAAIDGRKPAYREPLLRRAWMPAAIAMAAAGMIAVVLLNWPGSTREPEPSGSAEVAGASEGTPVEWSLVDPGLDPRRLASMRGLARDLRDREGGYPLFPLKKLLFFPTHEAAVAWGSAEFGLAPSLIQELFLFQILAFVHFLNHAEQMAEANLRWGTLSLQDRRGLEGIERALGIAGVGGWDALDESFQAYVRSHLLEVTPPISEPAAEPAAPPPIAQQVAELLQAYRTRPPTTRAEFQETLVPLTAWAESEERPEAQRPVIAEALKTVYADFIAGPGSNDAKARAFLGHRRFDHEVPEAISNRGYAFLRATEWAAERTWFTPEEAAEFELAERAWERTERHLESLVHDSAFNRGDRAAGLLVRDKRLAPFHLTTMWSSPYLICYVAPEQTSPFDALTIEDPIQRRTLMQDLQARTTKVEAILNEEASIFGQLYREYMLRYAKALDLKPLMAPWGGRPDYPDSVRSYRDGVPLVVLVFADRQTLRLYEDGYAAPRDPQGPLAYFSYRKSHVCLYWEERPDSEAPGEDTRAADARVSWRGRRARTSALLGTYALEFWFSRQQRTWRKPRPREDFFRSGFAAYLGAVTSSSDGRLAFDGLSRRHLADMNSMAKMMEARGSAYPLFPLAKLLSLRSAAETKAWASANLVISRSDALSLFRQQAWALVYFLNHAKNGAYRTQFDRLHKLLLNGEPLVGSVEQALGLRIENEWEDLEDRFHTYIKNHLLKLSLPEDGTEDDAPPGK